MYVAITRARKRLYLSHSQTRMLHGQTRYNVKSRFFDELPEGALKWLTPKNQNFGGSAFGFGGAMAARAGAAVAARRVELRPQQRDLRQPAGAGAEGGAVAWAAAGMQVFHAKFGEGTVLSLEGQGDDARAQVKFGRHGVKWLALSVAKLTPVCAADVVRQEKGRAPADRG
jgi:DNA helicase-2/ATP-dependent DNA helicase PcrA